MPDHPYKLLIIGGSAGSLEVILRLLPGLREDLGLPVIIVMHRKNTFHSMLAELLSAKTSLTVKEVEDKEKLEAGTIYIAPPDYHLLIEKDHTLSLDYSEKVNHSRPSIDVSFETAAEAFGNSLACLLLSGANADGVEGLKKVNESGGLTLVQNPSSAEVSYMPLQAVLHSKVDRIIEVDEMADIINRLNPYNDSKKGSAVK